LAVTAVTKDAIRQLNEARRKWPLSVAPAINKPLVWAPIDITFTLEAALRDGLMSSHANPKIMLHSLWVVREGVTNRRIILHLAGCSSRKRIFAQGYRIWTGKRT
jgi:hypothetical protein